jgi:uncharacterized membrane protein
MAGTCEGIARQGAFVRGRNVPWDATLLPTATSHSLNVASGPLSVSLGHMGKGRLEAFSDGVLAIIITIMVLELKPPHGYSYEEMREVLSTFASYALSFIYIGIYWNNHHHLWHAVKHVSGRSMWANLHLLFWLSLMPFATGWMGNNHFASVPMAVYGALLFLCAIAFTILVRSLIKAEGEDSVVAHAIGGDSKGNISLALYAIGVPLAFFNRALSAACYVIVACIWLIPDRRIEHALREHHHTA